MLRKLNFKSDYQKLLKHVRQRIKEYPKYINRGPGEDEDPISLITFGFSFEQSGWYALVFDTRPDAMPDGQWTLHIGANAVDCPKWCLDDVESIDIQHYDPKWKEPRSLNDEVMAKQFGILLRDVLLECREKGYFGKLPLAKNCCMFVEEFEGRFGWPAYKQMRKIGRVQK